MSQLSIIIPAWGDAQSLETTLGSVLRHRPDHCEVLVIHDGAYEDPYDVCDEVLFVESPGADQVDLLNVGVQIAECPIVNFLGCGVEVSSGWADAARRHFDNDNIASVAGVEVRGGRIASAGVEYAAGGGRKCCGKGRKPNSRAAQRLAPVGPSLQNAFYRRDCLEWLQGFHDGVGPDLTDLDLALALERLGYESVLEPESIVAATPAIAAKGSFTQGKQRQCFVRRHAQEQGAQRLSYPLRVAGEFAQELLRGGAIGTLCGRLVGLLQRGERDAFDEEIDTALEAATAANVRAFPKPQAGQQRRRAA